MCIRDSFFGGPGLGVRGPFGRMGNVNWVILGFRPQKCTQFFLGPRTSDFRPDYGDPYIKGPKRQFVLHFLTIFSTFFPYIWPLAGPNIAEKGAAIVEKALGSLRDGFGSW